MNNLDISLKSWMILEALVREKNVSRAAVQLNMSQPAVSNALTKLRDALGDPLLVRTSKGMVPTARALEISIAVKEVMTTLSTALESTTKFEPKSAKQTFRLAMTDYMEWAILPKLCALVQKDAPHVKLEVLALKEEIPFTELEDGKIDLALGHFREPRQQWYMQNLFEEDFVCVVKKGHGIDSRQISMEAYSSLSHLLVAPWGGLVGIADALLREKGFQRNIVASISHFLVGPIIAQTTGYCVTLPRRLAVYYAEQNSLDVFELPFRIPVFNFQQLWHARTQSDPGQKWIRSLIKNTAETQLQGTPNPTS